MLDAFNLNQLVQDPSFLALSVYIISSLQVYLLFVSAPVVAPAAVALGQCDLGAALKWPTFFQLHAVFPIPFRLTHTE